MRRLLLSVVVSGLAASAGPALVAGPAHAAQEGPGDPIGLFSSEGTYVATTPTRVFDSRSGTKLQGGQSATVPVLGKAGVPSSGVTAVVINLTATRAAQSGYLTAYPSTSSPGGTSNVIFAKGESRASLVTVPVGDDGSIKVLDGGGSKAGAVDAIVDVQGYYQDDTSDSDSDSETGASFQNEDPSRLVDTRSSSGGAVESNGTLKVTVSSDDDQGQSGATALAVNLTAVSPTAPGFLTAWDGTSERPSTSNVNFAAGQTTPNNAIVPLSLDDDTGDSSFSVYNGSKGKTQVVVDVVGAYYDGPFGLRFQPLDTPVRIVNSTTGSGTDKLGADDTATVQAPSSVRAAGDDNGDGRTNTLVGTLVAVRPSAATYLTLFATGEDRPEVSNLNPYAGQSVANHAFAPLSESGEFNIYNYRGTTDVLVDVTGGFQQPTFGTSASSAKAAAANRAKARMIERQREQHPVKVLSVTRSTR